MTPELIALVLLLIAIAVYLFHVELRARRKKSEDDCRSHIEALRRHVEILEEAQLDFVNNLIRLLETGLRVPPDRTYKREIDDRLLELEHMLEKYRSQISIQADGNVTVAGDVTGRNKT